MYKKIVCAKHFVLYESFEESYDIKRILLFYVKKIRIITK